MLAIAKSQKSRKFYECKNCNYKSCNKYDFEKHRWFTTDLNNKMIEDFERIEINFWSLINDLGLTYDKENKTWYSYKTNDKISQYFNT